MTKKIQIDNFNNFSSDLSECIKSWLCPEDKEVIYARGPVITMHQIILSRENIDILSITDAHKLGRISTAIMNIKRHQRSYFYECMHDMFQKVCKYKCLMCDKSVSKGIYCDDHSKNLPTCCIENCTTVALRDNFCKKHMKKCDESDCTSRNIWSKRFIDRHRRYFCKEHSFYCKKCYRQLKHKKEEWCQKHQNPCKIENCKYRCYGLYCFIHKKKCSKCERRDKILYYDEVTYLSCEDRKIVERTYLCKDHFDETIHFDETD